MVSEEENKEPDAIRSTRPDLSAGSVVNINGLAINRSSKVIGPVPGVHIGDLFFFRMEMCCIGICIIIPSYTCFIS
jgi:euchromatic histone-lysine N-methyltransferase